MKTTIVELAFRVIIVVCAATSQAAEIRFRSQAQCEGPVIRLGDVADVVTPDKREREHLQALELGPAGTTRQTLRSRDVQDRLSAQGVKLADHEFAGATAIAVTPQADEQGRREGRPLSKAAITLARTAVIDRIVQQLKNSVDAAEDWSVEVDLSAEQLRAIGNDYQNVSVVGGRAPWTGAQKFIVTVPSGRGSTSFTVAANVKRAARAVVAINPIARGERIGREDVELQPIKQGSARSTIQSLEEVVGQEAARNIPAGTAIDTQYIRSPILVKRGDVVDLFARAEGVQIRTKARARDEGGQGDLIKIELLNDRRALLARVCGIQEVEILAAGPAVSK